MSSTLLSQSSTLLSQLRRNGYTIALTVALAILPFTLVVFLFLTLDVDPNRLTRDTTTVAGVAPYIGFVSQLGLMLWAATIAIGLFTAHALRGRAELRPFRQLMFYSALFTLLLELDDAFLLHEVALPTLGLPEWATMGGYAVLAVVFLIAFIRPILRTDYLLLLAALLAFGTSMTLDLLDLRGILGALEDAAKFAGIALWLAYFAITGQALLTWSPSPPSA